MRRALGIVPILLLASLCSAAQPDRISGTIDSYPPVVLPGSVRAKAQPQYDQGPVEASFQLPYITMVMQPSAKQQADLQQLLKQQQDPSSANYHKWLTPEQYADRFGISQNDMQKISTWLQSQGFSIVQAARGRDWIAFSGTAALVESTFHTQIHYFNVDGERHFANATELSIPQALAGVVIGFRGLDNFGLKPMGIRQAGPADFFPIIVRPLYDTANEGHLLAPGDIATIYNITPLYNSNINGTGMKMVVVGQVDVSGSLSDINDFRSAFGLSSNPPKQTIVPGSPNPGTSTGDMVESKLDLEWAGAVARDATILFITADTSVGGVSEAAQYAIDQDLAPVISMSYGGCEPENVGFIPSNEVVQQQANTEGITFFASSGDTGAAGCDADTASVATQGLAVNYPASSPEVTGVGGNEFNEGNGNYWGSSGTNGGTALSYIPEMGWNDTASRNMLSASGGGASNCAQGSGTTCTAGFLKPAWQSGTGVPSDGVRDVPDVALTASPDHDGYIICDGGSCTTGVGSNPTLIVGGTSASTPVFAGIVTLLVQSGGGTGLGNINTKLYTLAQNTSNGIFHDVTTGNNIVPCKSGTPNCPATAPFQFGYNAGVGYDQVTGLGSVDAQALVSNFVGTHTTTTLTSSLNPAESGASVTFTASVSGNASHPPTGTVTFMNGTTQLGLETLVSGSAQLATFSLPQGSNPITGIYSGDAFNASSTSPALTEVINAASGTPTTTAEISGPNPSTFGSAVTFTATVTNGSVPPAPTGTVAFDDVSTGLPLGTGTVNQLTGVAALATSGLTGGMHKVAAVYNGDSNNAPSSFTLTQTVNQAATSTALSSGASSIVSGTSLTLTATVKGGTVPPTGSVTFNDAFGSASQGNQGTTSLGTATVNSSGVAALTTTGLITPGANFITAVYSGDTNYSTSTSSASSVTVSPATFTFSVSPATLTITSGATANYTLTITPTGSYTSLVGFTCLFSPASAASCAASPVTPNSSPATTTLTISGAQPAVVMAKNSPQMHAPLYALWMPLGVVGIFLTAGRKRTRVSRLKICVLIGTLLIVALGLFGCGGGSVSSTTTQQAQTYQITITASALATQSGSSTAVTATQTVSLTVNP